MSDIAAASALYALLAHSPSITNGHLMDISINALNHEALIAFSDFARIPGPAIRHVEMRAVSDLLGPPNPLHGVSLATCTTLRSLVLCLEPRFYMDPATGHEHVEDIRVTLRAYVQFVHEHRGAFRRLASVRIEMQPVGRRMLNAFERVAGDTYRGEWGRPAVQWVAAEEAEQNREVWASLEDVLCEVPALKSVEFVLYERPELDESLTTDRKVELRSTLERRLPRLWRSGAGHLVFETSEYRPL